MRGCGGSRRLRRAAGGRVENARRGAGPADVLGEKRWRREQRQTQHYLVSGRGRLSRGARGSQKRVCDFFGGAERGSRGKQHHCRMSGAAAVSMAEDEEILSDDEGVGGAADSASDTIPQRRQRSADHAAAEEGMEVEEGGTDEQRLRMARAFLRELAARQGSRDQAATKDEEQESDAEEEEEGTDDVALASVLRKMTGARSPHAFRETSGLVGLRLKGFLRGHKLPVTCAATPGMGDASEQQRQQEFADSSAASVDRHVYTGGKDCCLLRWDLQEEKKTVFQGKRNEFQCGGHFRSVLGLCVAPDESFFCSVGADQLLRIWDYRTSTTKCVAALRGHDGAISSVKFNNWPSASVGANTTTSSGVGLQSFSSGGDIEVVTCGADKSVKLWNLALRACLNSYFGHTAPINTMDVMLPNRPLTVGEDCTARSWKLIQDTHLVFSPQLTSVDACCYMTPSLFACGTQGGVISLYSTLQKKPLAAVAQQQRPPTWSSSSSTRGITAMTALRRSEVFFAGTEGGAVQMWRAKKRRKKEHPDDGDAYPDGANSASLQLASSTLVKGVVTSLCLTPSERTLVAAVSKESRLGRWVVDREARNGIAVFSLVDEQEGTRTAIDLEEEAYSE